MRGLFSLPAFILMMAFVGFTALAHESGLERGEAVFMTAIVWALPSQMVLVSAMQSSAGLLTTFIIVCLASVRLAPMVAALVPEIKTSRTRAVTLFFLSHFVAITAWVFTLQRIKAIPRECRTAYFAGLGLTLTSVNTLIVFFLYGIVSTLPPILAGTLYFLTPIYFLTSLWGSSSSRVIHLALGGGILLTPVFHLMLPDFDILAVGLVAGTGAYAIDLVLRRREVTGE
ncbi:AzlC family ABC transporter permease [Rhizobium sp. L1K21]|uniref:AzlC family ABC transporter permease n=1 Tax=Rhizobium sp. L1K21 TaxID=2954933 RepID=UPI002092469C|nr:AzlC family ABC transporter permease [Rhizobium sp. L1K21]MCO6185979.1 AzlC family ABC transporter permease [Rhizobium sp. L1K21]